MLQVITLITPVFGLIALGFLIGRTSYLSAGAGRVLAEFGFKVAMPALLFRAAAGAADLPASPLALLTAYFAASGVVWVLASVVARTALRRPAPDAPVVAMGSCFGNTVMLGIPIAVTAFGPEAAAPAAILVSVETPLLWLAATVQAEWAGRRSDRSVGTAVAEVALDLLKNPIILSLLLGTAWRFTGLTIPGPADRLMALLAQAAVPSALVALGLTLAGFRFQGQAGLLGLVGGAKLLLLPALVWLLATYVLELPPVWAGVAVLFAAMPTGANAYLFAVRYDRLAPTMSGAIAVTTLIAAVTVSTLLWAMGVGSP